MKKNVLFALVSLVATALATTIASSACVWFIYQPEEPACLQDK